MTTKLDELRAFFGVDGANYMRYLRTSDDVNYDQDDAECTDEVLALLAEAEKHALEISELKLRVDIDKLGDHERAAAELVGLRARVKELEAENQHLRSLNGDLRYQNSQLEAAVSDIEAENVELRRICAIAKDQMECVLNSYVVRRYEK